MGRLQPLLSTPRAASRGCPTAQPLPGRAWRAQASCRPVHGESQGAAGWQAWRDPDKSSVRASPASPNAFVLLVGKMPGGTGPAASGWGLLGAAVTSPALLISVYDLNQRTNKQKILLFVIYYPVLVRSHVIVSRGKQRLKCWAVHTNK